MTFTTISRRRFAQTLAAIGPASMILGQQSGQSEWGGPIVDCHHHLRRTPEANVAHLDGSGISNALILARESASDQIKALKTEHPGRILGWFASTDITKPDAEDLLTKAVKNGAIGFGEIKSHVEAAGPELRRMYALAAELDVPILVISRRFLTPRPRACLLPASRTSKPFSRLIPRPASSATRMHSGPMSAPTTPIRKRIRRAR